MSAGSNLKDAVTMLANSATALQGAIGTHVSTTSALTPDSDVQNAADQINSIAVALTQAAHTLQGQ